MRVDGSTVTNYTYNSLDQLTDADTGATTLDYDYDEAGNLTKRYDDANNYRDYYWSSGNKLTKVTGKWSGETKTYLYEYDAAGQLDRVRPQDILCNDGIARFYQGLNLLATYQEMANEGGGEPEGLEGLDGDPGPGVVPNITTIEMYLNGPGAVGAPICMATYEVGAPDESPLPVADSTMAAAAATVDSFAAVDAPALAMYTMPYGEAENTDNCDEALGEFPIRRVSEAQPHDAERHGRVTVAPPHDGDATVGESAKMHTSFSLNKYYHYDGLGNVIAYSNSAGDDGAIYVQDSFGNSEGAGTFSGKHLSGMEYFPEIGLYYFNARWYDPEIGRFISKSPMPADLEHPYVFCSNNPANSTDPTGLCPEDDGGFKSKYYEDDWKYNVPRSRPRMPPMPRSSNGSGSIRSRIPKGKLGIPDRHFLFLGNLQYCDEHELIAEALLNGGNCVSATRNRNERIEANYPKVDTFSYSLLPVHIVSGVYHIPSGRCFLMDNYLSGFIPWTWIREVDPNLYHNPETRDRWEERYNRFIDGVSGLFKD